MTKNNHQTTIFKQRDRHESINEIIVCERISINKQIMLQIDKKIFVTRSKRKRFTRTKTMKNTLSTITTTKTNYKNSKKN